MRTLNKLGQHAEQVRKEVVGSPLVMPVLFVVADRMGGPGTDGPSVGTRGC